MAEISPLPIDYTSRDYASIRADLLNLVRRRTNNDWQADDPSDLGVVLLESFAYMGDLMSYYIDRAANETYVDTATQRQTLLNIASLFGYRPSGPTPATVDVRFENKSTTAVDIPAGTQVMAPLLYSPFTQVYFETDATVTQLAPNANVTITATEGKTVNTDRPGFISPSTHLPLPVSLGVSDGSQNLERVLPEIGVVDDSVVVYVGQADAFAPWKFVDTLVEYGPFDKVFTTRLNANGSTSVVFGDGVNGEIPATGQLISALYRISAGISGNVSSDAIREITYIPGNPDPNALTALSVTNPIPATGGANADNNRELRGKLKKAISARRRAVTLADYEALALQVPQVGKAKAVAVDYSHVTIYLQPANDGSSAPGYVGGSQSGQLTRLRHDVEQYLADKVPVNTQVVTAPPVYVDLTVHADITINDAYRQDNVLRAVTKAMLDSPKGYFAYENIKFGQRITVSDLVVRIMSVPGVENVTITRLDLQGQTGFADLQLDAQELPRLQTELLVLTPYGGMD